ncbi:lamin tail domain-containing protein [Candidatus Pacearchaeota archaeon]|nr:lamin tail domain-containing protein [Candidatus Pacearchaeota archaeon]
MKKLYLLLLLISLIPIVSASILINEVLPNPASDWNLNGKNGTNDMNGHGDEWIELYNNGNAISLDNWSIGDKVKNYTLKNITICQDCFIVLYGNNTSLQLNNNNESIFLYDENGILKDNYSYSTSSKDVSLCKCQEDWKTCNPTPKSQNNCPTPTNQTNSTITEQQTIQVESQPQTENESHLEIVSAPDSAFFGETIDVKISAYRGDTQKYAVYTLIQGDDERLLTDEISRHVEKYSNLVSTISLKINNNCDRRFDIGSYNLIVRGLNTNASKKIEIKQDPSLCEEKINEILYDVIFPKIIEPDKEFTVEVNIDNNEDRDRDFEVWSYIYKGSVCYSCENDREENKQDISIDAKESDRVVLKDKIKNINIAGDYKLKVKIKKEAEDPKEYTLDVYVKNLSINLNTGTEQTENIVPETETNQTQEKSSGITGKVVYQSNKIVNKTTIILVIIAIFLLLYLLIVRKEKKPVNEEIFEDLDGVEFKNQES